MDNKAPGTAPRTEGYASATNAQGGDNFFRPKQKIGEKNIQRAGLLYVRKVGFYFTVAMVVFILMPSYLGPLYVEYVVQSDWLKRAQKTIWQRRNDKDYDLYMTQRKNTWTEWLGLKHYNISGDTNHGEIQQYRRID